MNRIEEKIQQLEKQILENHITEEKKLLINEMKKIGIEKLPYSYSALKQFIDSETMNFHYNKHYKGYVDKLNDALSKKKYGDLDLEKIIKTISRFDKTIRNNAGGAFNHALFWNMLTPTPKKLQGELYKKITRQYGTFTAFKKEFEKIAKERFGSGWVWLVLTPKNTLKIMSTANQDNPLMNVVENGGFPLLGLDLWEHAYYLKYRNKRDEYIENFWKVVNWDFVSKMFEMKTETNLTESQMSKQILTEGNSYIESCSKEEERFFSNLLSNNDISKEYGTGIYSALKTLPWLEFRKRDLENNVMQGFYKDGERHPISYLAGNHRAFCLITKSINKLLRSAKRQPIILSKKSEKEQVKQIKRLVLILKQYSSKIFDEKSPFYQSIISNLGTSKNKGEKVESLTFKRLGSKFGKDNVKIESGFGVEADSGGLDAEITINDKKNTAQIKPLTSYDIQDNKVVVKTTGRIANYTQDWMIFSSQSETIIFKNENVEHKDDSYVFPKETLIYKLT
jgi:Fe-Mn family superoxide dismutase